MLSGMFGSEGQENIGYYLLASIKLRFCFTRVLIMVTIFPVTMFPILNY